MENVLVALITSGLALIGIIMTNRAANNKIEQSIMQAQAVTDVKIEQLTTEVRKHNGFADRITKLETKIDVLEKRFDK